MDNGKLLDIEDSLEKTFINEWISKLRIWIRIDKQDNYLYRKEVLEELLQSLENYPKSNNVSIYTSEISDVDWYEVGHGEPTEWERIETVTAKHHIIIKGIKEPFSYVLGKHLKIYAKKSDDERTLEYNTNDRYKGNPVEDKDYGEGWLLEPLTEKNRRNK